MEATRPRLIRPDQGRELRLQEGEGLRLGIGTLEHDFQDLLAEMALPGQNRAQAAGLGAIFG